jgi:hypothetical protein
VSDGSIILDDSMVARPPVVGLPTRLKPWFLPKKGRFAEFVPHTCQVTNYAAAVNGSGIRGPFLNLKKAMPSGFFHQGSCFIILDEITSFSIWNIRSDNFLVLLEL